MRREGAKENAKKTPNLAEFTYFLNYFASFFAFSRLRGAGLVQ